MISLPATGLRRKLIDGTGFTGSTLTNGKAKGYIATINATILPAPAASYSNKEKASQMGISPTASLTDLLLQCPRPFEDDTVIESDGGAGEPARWGKAFHLHLLGRMLPESGAAVDAEAALARYNLPSHLSKDLLAGTKVAAAAFREFLGGANPWKVRFTIEVAEVPHMVVFAEDDGDVYADRADFDEESHSYRPVKELPPNAIAIGATPDYVLLGGPAKDLRVLLDLKTGDYNPSAYSSPEKLGQLLTLAAGFHANAVAVMHTPRPAKLGDPWRVAIHTTDLQFGELEAHAKRVRAAYALVGSGFMRTGPGCRWCPAREDCPTQIADRLAKTGALMKAAGGLVPGLAKTVDLGAFVEGSRKLEKLMKEARDEVKERVRDGEVIETLDGRVYEIVRRGRRSLSLGSVERALGRVRGAKEIERLELLGCIERVEYEELKAK
jgi:hypothetical protein